MEVRQDHRTEDLQQQQRRVDGTRAFIVSLGVRMEGAVKYWGKDTLAKMQQPTEAVQKSSPVRSCNQL